MKHVPPVEVDEDLWKAFKIVVATQGLKVKEAIPQALIEYIQNHSASQVKIDFKVIQDSKKNLLTFVYEEELQNLLSALIDAKKRNAPRHFMEQKKKEILDLVKKHPAITKELADEIVQTFKQLS